MPKPRSDILQGTLALLALKTLARGRLHGYAISAQIERISQGRLRVEEGSLYPALRRMEREGWITSTWSITPTNRRARTYTLTGHGRRQLALEEENWIRITTGVQAILRYRPGVSTRLATGAW